MVDYFNTTDDAKLATGYSRVENVITKSLKLSLNAGYSYDLQIIFGLTSLKCDVDANSSWENYNIIL
jgi:hypothetical protein